MSGARGEATRPGKRRSRFHIDFGSLRFYAALIVVALALHYIGLIVSYIPLVEPAISPELENEYKKKQLDIWAEMNKLLIALATAGIGGIGGYVHKQDKTSPLAPRELRRAAAGWIFCALSLYFGYLSYHEATTMLSVGRFNSNSPRLWAPTQAQFWSFLIAALLFADLVYGAARARRES